MADFTEKDLRTEIFDKDKDYEKFIHALSSVCNSEKTFCSDNISSSYFKPREHLIYRTEIVFLLYGKSRQPDRETKIKKAELNTLMGFAICYREKEKNTLFIDVIAAKSAVKYSNLGTTLLKNVAIYAYNENYSGLELSSLSNVLGYYRKFGFKHIKNCDEVEEERITKIAEEALTMPHYKTVENFDKNFYKNSILLEYIYVLVYCGYSIHCSENKKKQTKRQIFSYFVNKDREKYKKIEDCTKDGFSMIFSFSDPNNISKIKN